VEETSHTTSAPAAATERITDGGQQPTAAAVGDAERQPSTAAPNATVEQAAESPSRPATETLQTPAQQPGAGASADAGNDAAGDAGADAQEDQHNGSPGFGERGRMRRRARFLRKARELAYRDLGGLVFDLHRFGRRNDALVLAKLETIGRIDSELRTLEATLAERQPVTVLREAGIAACPRCAAIHGSEDRFCPHCGLAMDLNAERPVAGSAAPPTPPYAEPAATAQAPADAPGANPAPPAPVGAPTPIGAPTPAPVGAPTEGRLSGAPAPRITPPAGPAPAPEDRDGGPAESRSGADQPTEIIRPQQDP
jgi:hypothetical protein